MQQYETVIGLEVHAQLLTQTKIFCSCSTSFGAEPNTHTCPVCLGLPGALPVLNKKAVFLALKAGISLGCKIQKQSVWARKNYFYPDLPKGYQISQFDEPICLGGHLDFVLDGVKKKINLTRIHMEEDAGKLLHDYGAADKSHVDLNRAGTPLVEIVSEPEIRSAQEAAEYMRTLRSILVYAEVCDGNMEEGSLRCDANVSIRPIGATQFGTRVEIKNINSFKFVEKAIEYEVERQKACLAAGEPIVQETRLWDSQKNITVSMRSKEEAHDYRYFPDPDLLPLVIDEALLEQAKKEVPELPHAKADRFVSDYQIPPYDAGVLTAEKNLADFFENAVKNFNQPKKISNWIMTELLAKMKDANLEINQIKVSSKQLARLLEMVDQGTISGKIAKTVFEDMFETGKNADDIVKEKNLGQVSDTGAIEKVIDDVIAQNPKQLEQYRSGKDKLFGFFVGCVMKATKGQANPEMVNEILKKKLAQQ